MTLQSRKSQTNRDVLVSVSVVWKVVRLLCWGHRVTHACLPPFLCWRGSQESQPRALGGTRTYSLDLSFPSPALWPVQPVPNLPSHVAPARRSDDSPPARGEASQRPVHQRRESKFPASLPRLPSQGKRRRTQHWAPSGAGIFCTPWRLHRTSWDGRKRAGAPGSRGSGASAWVIVSGQICQANNSSAAQPAGDGFVTHIHSRSEPRAQMKAGHPRGAPSHP